MLMAPAGSGGSAAFLQPPQGVVILGAKTGTPTNDETQDTGKSLLFAFQAGTSRYTVLISVVSPKPSWPLALGLHSSDLGPLASDIVRMAVANKQPGAHRTPRALANTKSP